MARGLVVQSGLLCIKLREMTKVNFQDLDAENKLEAIQQIMSIENNKPNGPYWKSEDDLGSDLEGGYLPDDDFTFYVNKLNQLTTEAK